jgi:L(+)-tartrate dehydratase beta subunit
MPESVLRENLLIHAGPIIVRDGGQWRLVSIMPTSSIRFEKWGARAVDAWNLKMIIGKTTMGKETIDMMVRKKCVHCSPQGVTPNLFINHIKILGVDNFDALGSIEATWLLELDSLGPFIVDIDCKGNNLFDAIDHDVEKNKERAYQIAEIPPGFTFTKLY